MAAVRLFAAAAISLLAVALAPVAHSDTTIFINGFLNPPLADATTALHGRYASGSPVTIDYPQYSPFLGDAMNTGIANLDAAVTSTSGPITVIGYSEGASIVDGEMRDLASDPNAPSALDVRFVVIEDPLRPGGFVHSILPLGTWVPIVDIHVLPPPETPYDLTIVIQEYDGIADWPDRPWNLVAVANAVMGTGVLTPFLPSAHGAGVTADLDAVPQDHVNVDTNGLGATTTTYLMPTANLPLTDPLRVILPDGWVDEVDRFLRPIVDLGYSRNDSRGTGTAVRGAGATRTESVAAGHVVEAETPSVAAEVAPAVAANLADSVGTEPEDNVVGESTGTSDAATPRHNCSRNTLSDRSSGPFVDHLTTLGARQERMQERTEPAGAAVAAGEPAAAGHPDAPASDPTT